MPMPYAPISDYALIGNGQSAALVGREGSIDWCCWPRFDSPAVFCRLLDHQRGGYFQIAPSRPTDTSRNYLPATNILQTTFSCEQGSMKLTDLMPAPADREGERVFPHRLVRHVECVSGELPIRLEFKPTFEFALTEPRFETDDRGAVAYGREEALAMTSPIGLQQGDQMLFAEFRLHAGEELWFALTHGQPPTVEHPLRETTAGAEQEYERTVSYWQQWAAKSEYEGPYADLVRRSALALKLLVYQPTGGIIAAPTTSLPVDIGGVRNWDYRYTWLRDSGLVLDALQQLGYHQESVQFVQWLESLCLTHDPTVHVMYTVTGEAVPKEVKLEHLSGYCNSKPVRVGNSAVTQRQIDTYGHIIDAVLLCYERMPRTMQSDIWAFLCQIADWAGQRWPEPDHGPWEIRGEPQHYLYSKLYCWVGLDRMVRFAEKHGKQGNLAYWKQQREAIRQAILTRGYNENLQAFTQAFGTDNLDAGALTLSLTGFLPVDDPRMQSTIARIQEELTNDGLVYRYLQHDGLSGRDTTFTLCTLWMVMNLAMLNRLDEARTLFHRVCRCTNDLDLLSEQIEPGTDAMLGNFPQGFSHLGLIRAALHLREAEQRLEGKQ